MHLGARGRQNMFPDSNHPLAIAGRGGAVTTERAGMLAPEPARRRADPLRRIALLHGTVIWIGAGSGANGRGARFQVLLPIAA